MAPEKRKAPDVANIENSASKKQKLSDGWECQNCGFKNSSEGDLGCHGCGEPRSRNPLKDSSKDDLAINEDENSIWNQLVNLEMDDIILNIVPFECPVCFEFIEAGNGVYLKECLHAFCCPCLKQIIINCKEAEVICPYVDKDYDCRMPLQHREIRSLCTVEEYSQYLDRSIKAAENTLDRTFHCLQPDCLGWCEIVGEIREFSCPVCGSVSCMNCNAIHDGMNCAEFQNEEVCKAQTHEILETRKKLNNMLQTGLAMRCPNCSIIIVKNGGCAHMKCRMCKKDFTWNPSKLQQFEPDKVAKSLDSKTKKPVKNTLKASKPPPKLRK